MDHEWDALELELRAASDQLVLAAEQVLAFEQLKRRIDVSSGEFRDLAVLIEEQSRDLAVIAAEQRRIAEALAGAAEAVSIGTVEAISAEASLADILARWRSAERQATTEPPGTLTAHRAAIEARVLREEYRRAYQQLTGRDQERSG